MKDADSTWGRNPSAPPFPSVSNTASHFELSVVLCWLFFSKEARLNQKINNDDNMKDVLLCACFVVMVLVTECVLEVSGSTDSCTVHKSILR